MRRLFFIAAAMMVMIAFVSPQPAKAYCTEELLPFWVDVEWGDGSHGGHWQFGWFTVCYSGGGGGGGGTLPPPGGGGGYYGPDLPQDLLDQRQLYADNGCTEPSYGEFLTQDAYAATGMGTWFPWEDFRMNDQPYVLVSDVLAAGARDMALCMDNNIPRISAPGTGGGYRTPGLNANTPCGQHVYGNALDLSIRATDAYGNNTGAHDCHLWNALAACANAAGGWVEPWQDIKDSGVLHFHVSFGQPANTPSNYGDACANP